MLRTILNWLQSNGLIFATLLINLLSGIITILAYLLIAISIAWWDKHT